MNTEQIKNIFANLKMYGALAAYSEQENTPNVNQLSFDERLYMIMDREKLTRETNAIKKLISRAKFKVNANIESIDYSKSRGLDQAQLTKIFQCDFIRHKSNMVITGATGAGKTYLACAIGHQACRMKFKTLYISLPTLFHTFKLAMADGTIIKLISDLSKPDLLILDDFGISQLSEQDVHELFRLIDSRYSNSSTIITSQLPTSEWHTYINNKTLADSILDRVLNNIQKIEMKGDSMRSKNITQS